MQFKDYYAVLGVSRVTAAEDIKKAFRKLARKYHPDVSKEPDAAARMTEINEANAVLGDIEKRAAYDQLGKGHQGGQDFQPPPDWDAGFEFSEGSAGGSAAHSDFFEQLFGRMGGTGGRGQQGFQLRGEDHHAKVMLDIEDSFSGATKQITLRAMQLDDKGRPQMVPRTLNVKIPRGVSAGQTIRLAGQGGAGHGGAAAGDLLLEVQFNPHARWRADAHDLHLSLPLAPWEAALGTTLTVDLAEGSIKVRIPANAQGGQQLRVRGKGLPSTPPGDLLLELRVVLPPADTPKATELYNTMARELNFNPRQEANHA